MVPPASLVAAPPPQSALKEEGGNAVYNADNIVKATNTTNVVNTASANANNLWELKLDLPIPMHPTSMANNNYSVHEQEIILGSKSFTLGTPYTQHELIEENVNTTTAYNR